MPARDLKHYAVHDKAALPGRLAATEKLRALSVEGGELDADLVVGIVGTREAGPIMTEAARWIARRCAEEGFVVASGGARGIDAAAHEGALEVDARLTWAVLPGGCNGFYPESNRSLFDRIRAGGGRLVWTFPPEQAPWRTFHERNRILVELADAIIVVESPHRSGTKNTVGHARAAKKPIWVVPPVPWADCSGNDDILNAGANLLETMEPFFESFGIGPRHDAASATSLPLFPEGVGASGPMTDEQLILGKLGSEPRHPDEIVRMVGLSLPRVSRALLTLSLDAVVVVGPDGRYRRCR